MAKADITISAVDNTQQAFDSVRRNLTGLEQTAGKLSGILAGIGVGLSAGALAGLVRTTVNAADELGKLSQKVGVTVETLSELQYAGKLADVSTEQLGDALRKLSVNLQAGAAGSREFVDAFQLVGITAAELNTLKPDEALRRIATAFAGMEDGAQKTALAVRLVGRNGSDLIPLLNGGAAGLRAAGDEARRFGVVMSTDTARAAEAFNDNMTRLKTAAEGFGQAVTTSVLPGISQTALAMASAAAQGGALYGVLRGIAELGKIALQGGVDGDALAKQREYIASIRGEISKLQESAAGRGPAGTGLLDRLIYGDAAQKERKLAELRITLRDAEKALANMQRSGDAAAPKAQSLGLVDRGAASTEIDLAAGAERGARIFTQIYLDQFAILTARGREVQQGLLEVFEEGNRIDAAAAKEQADALKRIFAGTRSGQEAEVFKDLETLNDALIVGKINAEKYEEAYGTIQERLNQIRGIGKDAAKETGDEWTFQLDRIEFAVQGWGRSFTNTLADAVETGKVQVSDLVQSILRDLLRLQIQRSITKPLFDALSGSLGNISTQLWGGGGSGGGGGGSGIGYGAGQGLRIPGAATGGSFPANYPVVVGEAGPEVFVPRTAGTVIPNGALPMGGVTFNQTINVAPGVSAGAVYQAARMGAEMAKSDIARAVRTGAMG